VIDERTLDITTTSPMAYFEFDVSFNGCQILPPQYMEEVGEEEFARNPVGSGPYVLVEFTASDRYVFEAWDGYWAGRPEVDRIVYQVIPEQSSQIAALLAGQIDFVRAIPPVEQARLARRPPASTSSAAPPRSSTSSTSATRPRPASSPRTTPASSPSPPTSASAGRSATPSTASCSPRSRARAPLAAAHRRVHPRAPRPVRRRGRGDRPLRPRAGPRPDRRGRLRPGRRQPPRLAPRRDGLPAGEREGGRRGRWRRCSRTSASTSSSTSWPLRLPGADLQPGQLPRHRADLGRRQPLAAVPQFYTCAWRNPNALPCVLDETGVGPTSAPIRAVVNGDVRLELWESSGTSTSSGRGRSPSTTSTRRWRSTTASSGPPRRRLDDLPRPQAAPLSSARRAVRGGPSRASTHTCRLTRMNPYDQERRTDDMQGYIARRLSHLVFTIFVVSLIVFFLVRLKGDPISVLVPPTFTRSRSRPCVAPGARPPADRAVRRLRASAPSPATSGARSSPGRRRPNSCSNAWARRSASPAWPR
jgi:hypothetical protein